MTRGVTIRLLLLSLALPLPACRSGEGEPAPATVGPENTVEACSGLTGTAAGAPWC